MEDVATKFFTIPMDAVQLLTIKGLDVYEMLVKGMQSKEVALKLNNSVRTVKFHIVNIYKKFNVHDRGQLIWSYKNKTAVLNDEAPNWTGAYPGCSRGELFSVFRASSRF
jgi:DNA-binding NarL/FixJ family response regulator